MAAMSQRQYAVHRGVARSAVQRAIKDGRITTLADGRIDPELADRQWEERTRSTALNSGETGAFFRARAVRMHYEARMAKVMYDERIGRLIPKEEVQAEAFNKYRQKRDALVNIPDRVAATIAAERDVSAVRDLLATEILKAIEGD